MTRTEEKRVAGAVARAAAATTVGEVSLTERRREIISDALMGLTVPELRRTLAAREASTGGLRPELAARLTAILVAEAES